MDFVDLIFLRSMQRLVLPPANVLILLMIGFLLIRSRRSLGRLFIAAAFLLLYGLSISPVSSALMAPLEKSFQPVDMKLAKADVIIVLGGGTRDRSWLGFEPEPGEKSLQRVVAAVKLHRALHIPVLISGGAGDPDQPRLSDADSMARAASDLGVLEKDMVIENKSRNTLESVVAVKGLLKGNRIILVTSAYHMKRSVALFKKQGFSVIPAPSGFLTMHRPVSLYAFIPSADGLSTSSVALSEYISYAWYSVRGDL
jgi:uncharacterized SAM-binding protein YcdF (DUF218 family)